MSKVTALPCLKGMQESFCITPGKGQQQAGWPHHLAPLFGSKPSSKGLGQVGQEGKATQGHYNRQLSSVQVSPVRWSQGEISWNKIRTSTTKPFNVLWAIPYLGSRRTVLPRRRAHIHWHGLDLPSLDLIGHFKQALPKHLSFLRVSPLKIENCMYSLS